MCGQNPCIHLYLQYKKNENRSMYFWGQRVFELKMEAEICCKTENIST